MITEAASEPVEQGPPRLPRPNYGKIHAKSLPLNIFPLPPLIPHNPFSILHIAYVYLKHLVLQSSSHGTHVHGWLHPETNSVHITDPAHIRFLWERGFFGKGSLSRSEPTWLEREKKRLGLLGKDTSEEYTQQRREERRKMKMERARKEREAIEETLQREQQGISNADIDDNLTANTTTTENQQIPLQAKGSQAAEPVEGLVKLAANVLVEPAEPSVTQEKDRLAFPQLEASEASPQNHSEVLPQEHLQLSAEEAFFLVYALGILTVYDPASQTPILAPDLLTVFRTNSYFPAVSPNDVLPYDPFILLYVTYHHFRSLGWVVRPGLKFAVDWLLYLRGPAFAHAEFAVVVLPSFKDDYWWEDGRKEETALRGKRDWWWLHCLQRVQAQVRKGLVICWVEIPKPDEEMLSTLSKAQLQAMEAKGVAAEAGCGIGSFLKRYKVRDMILKRWIPNRNRD